MNTVVRRALLLVAICCLTSAVFAETNATITIARPHGGYLKSLATQWGTLMCGAEGSGKDVCSLQVPAGTSLTIIAVSNTGYKWTAFSEPCRAATSAQCTFAATTSMQILVSFGGGTTF